MKTIFLLLIISFVAAGSVTGSVAFKSAQSTDCLKCKADYKSCTDTAGKAYTTAIQNAADSLKSKNSKVDYRSACEEARRIKNKAIAECTEVYNKCCLAETKEIMGKNKKEEQ